MKHTAITLIFMKKSILILLCLTILLSGLTSCAKTDAYEIDWGNIVLCDVVPAPQSNMMKIICNDKTALHADVYEMSVNHFREYIRICEGTGFDIDEAHGGSTLFSARNKAGYALNLTYNEPDNKMTISLVLESNSVGATVAPELSTTSEPNHTPELSTAPEASTAPEITQKNVLNAEEIYLKCSPSVFYIETFDSRGNLYSTGSGFFISCDGVAVTNYHVVKDTFDARITLSDTGKVYSVLGICDYSEEEDWAILKVDGSDFPALIIGDCTDITGGATVYAIGSPLGLQNTISQGIISNPSRLEGGVTYYQTNAAISSGSSGGALLNAYGEVIGITSASYVDGQNLNLALPISLIEGYQSEHYHTLISVITGNENSTITGYAECAAIPDFGAFNAVPSYFSTNEFGRTTYYYSNSDLKAANTYQYAWYLYAELIRTWGFTATDFYADENENIIGKYTYDTPTRTYYIDFINGIDCTSLSFYAEEKKPAKAYNEIPEVPDFGDYFGVYPYSFGEVLVGWAYDYSLYDIYEIGIGDSFFEDYWMLLEAWGFFYKESEDNNLGTIYIFENITAEKTISIAVYDDQIAVIIYNMLF